MNTISAKLSKYTLYSLFLLFSGLNSSSILAEASTSQDKPAQHSHQNITEVARRFLDANIEKSQFSRVNIQMSQLDPRLRLRQCSLPLTSTLAPGSQFSGKTTVHLRCNSTSPWTVYIAAQIKLYGKVMQTGQPLARGHVLRKDDLVAVEEDLSRIRYGYFINKENLIGKQLKRQLPQGRIIKANYVKSQTLVKRGELVSIVAENTGYSVKMTGTAMSSGARGDRIRVKNTSSKRIVEGIIKEAGVVSIN
jgi:flagellar basal body P-ring formation protein FlgA